MKTYYNGVEATLPMLNEYVKSNIKEIILLCTKLKTGYSYKRLKYNLPIDSIYNYISSDDFVESILLNYERCIPEIFCINLTNRTKRMLLSKIVSNRRHINYLVNQIVKTSNNYDVDYILTELIFEILDNLAKQLRRYFDNLGGVLCV